MARDRSASTDGSGSIRGPDVRVDGISGRRTRALLLSAAALAMTMPMGRLQAQDGPPPASVRVAPVGAERLQARAEVVGRTRAVRRAIVAAEGAGRVVAVAVEEGDRVVGGTTVLARVDDVLERLALAEAHAQLAVARAERAAADADHRVSERHHVYVKGLAERGSATAKEVGDAADAAAATRARAAVAAAVIDRAEVSVRIIEQRLDRRVVKAPFDAVVVRKMTELGQWLADGSDVVELISHGAIDAVLDVPERLVNQVGVGDEIEVRVEPLAVSVRAKVIAVVPEGTATARTFPVKARFDDGEGRYKAGMSVTARIPTNRVTDVLTVPRGAIHRTPTGTVVWASVEGAAMPLSVRILFGHGPRYAVEPAGGAGPPLQPGMNVVIEGAERLFPGRPLMVAGPDASG